MEQYTNFLVFLLVLTILSLSLGDLSYYTNEWAVKLLNDGPITADFLAAKHGFLNLGQIGSSSHYSFTSQRLRHKRYSQKSDSHHSLAAEPQVQWMEQQLIRRRMKRTAPNLRFRRSAANESSAEEDLDFFSFNDPHWPDQWYLNKPNTSHKVQEAWNLDFTGRNITITVVDDGLERTHPDLEPNYEARASADINGNDVDPLPRYNEHPGGIEENYQGTRLAGIIAATANNSRCVVGTAYNANVGGVRMLDGRVTDYVEASSLSHGREIVDIYCAGWGPEDDGQTVDGPGSLTRNVFEEGVQEGRNGHGSIFVWAAGTGGKYGDSCAADGYVNSIYTIAIGSATEEGLAPWYGEFCSAVLAATYSSDKHLATTDLYGKCTTTFGGGTAASAAIASGIFALVLEANRNLTWRDLQHIVVQTAKSDLLQADDLKTNGVGRAVSNQFGYGILDAEAMVTLATTWTSVPEQHNCNLRYRLGAVLVSPKSSAEITLNSGDCAEEVSTLEHVQAVLTVRIAKRKDLEIFLTSPAGTKSTLLPRRPVDYSKAGYRKWTFMTVHNWGEPAVGNWTLEVKNRGEEEAFIDQWELVLHGTL